MATDTVTSYVFRQEKLEERQLPRDEVLKEIDELLEEDRDFLEIMAKL